MFAMMLFSGIGKLRESSRWQKTSWKTFEKVAMVRGLTAIGALRSIVRGSKIKRPSQILGSILLFDGVDVALDNGAVSEAEQGSSTGSGRDWLPPPLSGTGIPIAGTPSVPTVTSISRSGLSPGTAWTRSSKAVTRKGMEGSSPTCTFPSFRMSRSSGGRSSG